MDDFLIGAYIGVGSTLLGALVTYFLSRSLVQQTHRNDLELMKIDEFNKAAAAFHAEFSDVLFYLRQNIERGVGDKEFLFKIINTKELARYERAIILFEPFIERNKLVAFRDTWKNYKEYMKATEDKWADSPNPAETSIEKHIVVNYDKELNLNPKYLEHINALLEYAKRR